MLKSSPWLQTTDDDYNLFTDASVVRGTKSGWAFSARVDSVIVAEDSDATVSTLFSMQIKIITQSSWHYHRPIINPSLVTVCITISVQFPLFLRESK